MKKAISEKQLAEKLSKIIAKNLRKKFVIKPCAKSLEPARDLIEECYKKLVLPYYTFEKSEVDVSRDAEGNMKATLTFQNPSPALRKLIEESKK